MFCDLVGSTSLAAKLDAEDWRNLVNTYLDEASAAVTGLGGHVLKKLGDGLMALFGYAGAGHFGRALAQALRLLHFSPRLIDQRQTELDLAGPGTPTTLSVLPEAEIRAAPPGAAFVVLAHDHALDLLAVEAPQASRRGLCRYDREPHQACDLHPIRC